jgi:hypothetical protein
MRVRDSVIAGGKHQRANLGLRDDLFFTRVYVSTVDNANDVRLCALHQSDRSPEYTFSATACIAVFRVSMRGQMLAMITKCWNRPDRIHVQRLTSTDERNL